MLAALMVTVIFYGCKREPEIDVSATNGVDGPIFFNLLAELPKSERTGQREVAVDSEFEVTGTFMATEQPEQDVYVYIRKFRPNGRSSVVHRETAEVNVVSPSTGLYRYSSSVESHPRPGECVVQVMLGRKNIVDEATFRLVERDKEATD